MVGDKGCLGEFNHMAVAEMATTLGYLTHNPRAQAVGDLTLIAFYYLLRSGEYTRPRKVLRNGKMVHATRTRQFQIKDIGFWKDGRILPRTSPLSLLLAADACTLKITNQKNGRTCQTLHVAAGARLMKHVRPNNCKMKHF
jgi:hypothetical protein